MSFVRTTIVAALVAMPGVMGAALPARSYPIDCAILICLAGGWPASEPCSQARTEFIRRITPWPIEPPLQIWRCPMRVSLDGQGSLSRPESVDKAVSWPRLAGRWRNLDTVTLAGGQVREDQADIDISDAAFDFVRSIRVYHINVRQQDSDKTSCVTTDSTRLGSYGLQGGFTWAASSGKEVPPSSGLRMSGHCRDYRYRSVFVGWRDHSGRYGFEEVRY